MGVTVSSVSETVQEPLHSFVRRKATKRPKDGSFGKVCRKVLDDPGHIVTMRSPPPKKKPADPFRTSCKIYHLRDSSTECSLTGTG